MPERIVMRTGEALVEGDKDYLCADSRFHCETPDRNLRRLAAAAQQRP